MDWKRRPSDDGYLVNPFLYPASVFITLNFIVVFAFTVFLILSVLNNNNKNNNKIEIIY